MTNAETRYGGLSQQEFLDKTGLTMDELMEPYHEEKRATLASESPCHNNDVDPSSLLQDDDWVKNTIFTNLSRLAESPSSEWGKREELLNQFRIHYSVNSQSAIESVHAAKVLDEVTPERRRDAVDYKAQLLMRFRRSKKIGRSSVDDEENEVTPVKEVKRGYF